MKVLKLVRSNSKRGYYFGIDVEISENSGFGINVKFDESNSQWETAIKAGAIIFYEYFVAKNSSRTKQITVHVLSVDWLPVDTNNLIAVFATVDLLCGYYNLEVESLRADFELGRFFFPDARTLFR